jgi:hydroxymethylbilane synthase
VGTRGSDLALWQARWLIELLTAHHPDVEFEIVEVSTRGDRDRRVPLHQAGGVGLFVKALEYALLDGEIDLAVHSLKDMPSRTTPRLSLAAIPERADPRDALVSKAGLRLSELPPGSQVGTGSPRRRAQILALRPDLEVVGIRGNVDTRLSKVKEAAYDAVVLAAAGLDRLGRRDAITEILSPETMLPAAGQGALAVELRADDEATHTLVAPVNHTPSWAAAGAERAFMARLGAGCHVPAAAYAVVDEHDIRLRALVADMDGEKIIRGERQGEIGEAELLGRRIAEELLDRGAGELLREAERQI